MTANPMQPGELSEVDYIDAAQALACEVATVKAVVEVECPRSAFVVVAGVTRPRILFEAHRFSAETDGRFDGSHPHLSSRTWNRALYTGTDEGEWHRLTEARKLARFEADKAASWGKFQIMGFNFAAAGHPNVAQFVNDMSTSVRLQMLAFVAFCQHEGLAPLLASRNWSNFARRYNGPAYASHGYHTKLASAYIKHGGLA